MSLPSMPVEVRWITNLSFLTFSYTILMVNEFNGISILINPDGMSGSNPVEVEGALLLTQVGMKIDDLYPDMCMWNSLGVGSLLTVSMQGFCWACLAFTWLQRTWPCVLL